MRKVYVDPIKGRWKDEVGSKENRLANDAAEKLNDVAEYMEEILRKIENSKEHRVEFTPKTPELLELQERLERELGI